MNKEIYSAYSNDGFYIARGLIDPDKVDETVQSLKHAYDSVLVAKGGVPGPTLEASMKQLHEIDIEGYKKVSGALWRKLAVFNLLHHPAISSFLHDAFSWSDIFVPGGQVVHIMSDALRIPGGYNGITPHQDWPSVHGSLDGTIVWLPLMDIDRNLYPLEVIPGSNQAGLLPLKQDTDKPWEIHPEFYNPEDFVPVEVNKGDVVFMTYFTIHRSGMHGIHDRVRLACSTRFDNGDEPTFIERGYPTAYVRSVNRSMS